MLLPEDEIATYSGVYIFKGKDRDKEFGDSFISGVIHSKCLIEEEKPELPKIVDPSSDDLVKNLITIVTDLSTEISEEKAREVVNSCLKDGHKNLDYMVAVFFSEIDSS